jgi:hypothetical protein
MPAEHDVFENGNGHCGKIGKIDTADALYEIGSIDFLCGADMGASRRSR